jgi:subtilase family serine protease
MVTATPLAGPNASGPLTYTPQQISQAYGFNSTTLPGGQLATGAGQTIAVVDAYYDPNIAGDLATFDAQFGLRAPPSFQQVRMGGVTATDSGWATETSLDVEWAHAVAPQANILLVDAASNGFTDLFNAVSYAASQPGVSVVSMSWGGGEFPGENSYDNVFTTPAGHSSVTFVASSGDGGAGVSYPAASPNVLAVGGTSLYLTPSNNYSSESGWSGSGGGYSRVEREPSYQQGVQKSGRRTNPDVAYNADPNTGVYVYDTLGQGGWLDVGGTSAGAPQWSAVVALANQYRAASGLPTLGNTPADIYSLPASDFHDVTSGSNGYNATPGYDLVTGRGSPIVNRIVPGLGGASSNAVAGGTGGGTAGATPRAHAHDVAPGGDPTAGTGSGNITASTPTHVSPAMLSAAPLVAPGKDASPAILTDSQALADAALALGSSSSSPLVGGSFLGAAAASPTTGLAHTSLGMPYFGRPGLGWDSSAVGGTAALAGAVTPAMAQQILEGQDALPADPGPDAPDAVPADGGDGVPVD